VRVNKAVFGGLTIAYDERVLSPRAWTLHQSLWALELLDDLPDGPILELCAGAGQIGLAVAAGSMRRLICVDSDPVATCYASHNAAAAGLQDRVEVRLGPMSQELGNHERFPLILADPPWVRRDDVGRFPEDPVTAIDGGTQGLDVARGCISVIGAHLDAHGRALLQLGSYGQVESLEVEFKGQDLQVHASRGFGDRGVLVLLSR
jgi:release factor glutamine methyltransferase